MCITKPKVVEKGIAKIKKNEYQRNIKVMPRGPVPGQNICSLGAGHSFLPPLCPVLSMQSNPRSCWAASAEYPAQSFSAGKGGCFTPNIMGKVKI